MELVENIKINFLCGISVKNINFGQLLNNLSWEDQEILIQETILNDRNVKYPLKRDYQIAFIKHIIKELENGSEEVHDKFYECLSMIINATDNDFSFKHYKINKNNFISVKEANSYIRDGTTGLKVWEASITLTNFIIQNKEYFRDKSIIELGSGCSGLVGLSLLKLCDCKQIFLSDCHESVMNTLQENLLLNLRDEKLEKYESSVLVKERIYVNNKTEIGILNIPWENAEEMSEELSKICQPDIILAADIIYDSSIFNALLNCLNVLFKNFSNIEFILSQTIRNNETFEEFTKILRKNKFQIEDIETNDLEKNIPCSSDASLIKMFRIRKV
ncbi:hypothetical protein PVAND_000856 [Polypedilum vanderplanki]|uniref:FAM86 N-terminal domain-containing protein n=1 Tax=Polypedilum vanderplanki TaxID=319348 RepID=A0A9J6BMI1_POLVA|nr:hypothetical protein PVAND_000856 [Polypedilum vanderplanki]